jgi:hypothetical protein
MEPTTERTFAYGACTGCPEQDEMAELLLRHGLAVSKGRYNINATDCEHFLFEDWSPDGEWTLDGTAASRAVLVRDAHLVSKVLTAARVRHWLGIFDAVQNQMDYLHFDWPASDSQSQS